MPAGEVVGGDGEQPADQVGAHHRLVGRQGVVHPNGFGVVEPLDPAPVGIDEAPRDRLVEPGVAQQVLEPPQQPLVALQPPDRAARTGQGRRQMLVEAVDPCDLLDQVDLARDVEMPIRGNPDGDLARVRGSRPDLEAEAAQIAAGELGGDAHAEQRVAAAGPQGQLERVHPRSVRVGVDHARHEPRAAELDEQLRGRALRPDRQLGMELLLEPRRCLGAQRQQVGGAQDVGAVPGGGLEQHPGRRRRDLGDLPAHDSGDPRRAVAIADDDALGVERALDPVERRHTLTLGGRPHDDLAPGHLVEVEGVQRLAGQQHHVVGDVDDVVDRPLAGGDQAGLEPERRWADRDVDERARREPRTEIGNVHPHRCDLGDVAVAGRLRIGRPGRTRQLGAAQCMDLARHPEDAEAIGAVGCDLELEHLLGDREKVSERRAGGRLDAVQHGDSVAVLAELHLGLGEDHPRRLDAAQLGLAELRPVRHHGARERDGDRLAIGHVGSAADDRARLAIAGVDRADLEPIGIRMGLGGEHPADHEPVGRRDAELAEPFDLGAGHREALGERPRLDPGIAEGREPADRDPHQNCSRRRTSLSKNIRRSGTPCLSIATRSMPSPKANPWTRSGS